MWWGKTLTLQEQDLKRAIREAIRNEKDAMDFYRVAAEKMFYEKPRLTFRLLAREEREHARSFYDLYRWNDLPPFDELMAMPPDTSSGWWQNLEQAMLGEFDEEMALTLAIEKERSHEKRLRALAEHITDPKVRAVYLENADMTHHHLELVSADLRTGYPTV